MVSQRAEQEVKDHFLDQLLTSPHISFRRRGEEVEDDSILMASDINRSSDMCTTKSDLFCVKLATTSLFFHSQV